MGHTSNVSLGLDSYRHFRRLDRCANPSAWQRKSVSFTIAELQRQTNGLQNTHAQKQRQ